MSDLGPIYMCLPPYCLKKKRIKYSSCVKLFDLSVIELYFFWFNVGRGSIWNVKNGSFFSSPQEPVEEKDSAVKGL